MNIRRASLFAWIAVALATAAARAQDELQQVSDELQDQVAEITGVRLRESVQTVRQSRDEFAEYLRTKMSEDLPPERAAAYTQAYRILGLVPEDYDLIEGMQEAYRTQAGAYYDPQDKRIRVLQEGLNDQMLRFVLFHELVHAVQDQEAGLGALMERLERRDDDRARAAQFLWEGEAQMYTTLFQMQQMGVPDGMAEMSLRMQAQMTRRQLLAQARMAERMGQLPEEMAEQMEALERIPTVLFHTLVAPYLKGAWAAYRVYQERGADGLRELYRRPPPSTKVMLFPELLLAEAGPPEPHEVVIPPLGETLGTGWTRGIANVMGSAVLLAMFESDRRASERIARGWDGDRYELWRNGDQAFLVWAVHFESEEAAVAFAGHYERRFREETSEEITEVGSDPLHLRRAGTAPGRELVLARESTTVYLYQGNLEPPEGVWDALRRAQMREPEPEFH